MVTLFIFHILLIYCKLHHLLRSSLFFYFKGFLKDIAVLLLHALEKIYMPVFSVLLLQCCYILIIIFQICL